MAGGKSDQSSKDEIAGGMSEAGPRRRPGQADREHVRGRVRASRTAIAAPVAPSARQLLDLDLGAADRVAHRLLALAGPLAERDLLDHPRRPADLGLLAGAHHLDRPLRERRVRLLRAQLPVVRPAFGLDPLLAQAHRLLDGRLDPPAGAPAPAGLDLALADREPLLDHLDLLLATLVAVGRAADSGCHLGVSSTLLGRRGATRRRQGTGPWARVPELRRHAVQVGLNHPAPQWFRCGAAKGPARRAGITARSSEALRLGAGQGFRARPRADFPPGPRRRRLVSRSSRPRPCAMPMVGAPDTMGAWPGQSPA